MKLLPRSTLDAIFGVSTTIPEFIGRDAGSAMRERADIGCLLLNVAVYPFIGMTELHAAVGLEFPLNAGAITEAHPNRVLWLTPRSWLIQCPVDAEWTLERRINEAIPDKRVHAALYTDYLCWFELCGIESGDLLRRHGFVSLERGGLPLGHAKRTLVAGIAAVVVREGENAWLVGVERNRAHYFADTLVADSREGHSYARYSNGHLT
jgi:heterotetrameric sarcosine oxidase gamma subunit